MQKDKKLKVLDLSHNPILENQIDPLITEAKKHMSIMKINLEASSPSTNTKRSAYYFKIS